MMTYNEEGIVSFGQAQRFIRANALDRKRMREVIYIPLEDTGNEYAEIGQGNRPGPFLTKKSRSKSIRRLRNSTSTLGSLGTLGSNTRNASHDSLDFDNSIHNVSKGSGHLFGMDDSAHGPSRASVSEDAEDVDDGLQPHSPPHSQFKSQSQFSPKWVKGSDLSGHGVAGLDEKEEEKGEGKIRIPIDPNPHHVVRPREGEGEERSPQSVGVEAQAHVHVHTLPHDVIPPNEDKTH